MTTTDRGIGAGTPAPAAATPPPENGQEPKTENPKTQRVSDKQPEWKYPFPLSTLRDGDKDPTLNKTVQWLIDSDDDFIIYLDEENYVEWNMNEKNRLSPETGEYLNWVGALVAIDTSYLRTEQKQSYQRMIGEGVVRLFQNNLKAAQAALDLAEQWIIARNTEVARRWYLTGSGVAALVSVVAVCVLGFWNTSLRGSFSLPIYNVLMGTAVGGLGAWLSVIQRSRTTELDVAAGPWLHYLEGAFRIMVDTLGAMLIALAIRAGLVLQGDRLSAIMVICMVAGASERLVPSFIEQIESRTVARDSKAAGDKKPA
jgi:hypothetical protein